MSICLTYIIKPYHFFEHVLSCTYDINVSPNCKLGSKFKSIFINTIKQNVNLHNVNIDPKVYDIAEIQNRELPIKQLINIKNKSCISEYVRFYERDLIKFSFKNDNNQQILMIITIFNNNFKNLLKFLKLYGISNKTHTFTLNDKIIDNFNLTFHNLNMNIVGGRKYDIVCSIINNKNNNNNSIINDTNNITNIISMESPKKHKRKTIPSSLRNAVWTAYNGKVYESKCYVGCGSIIDVTTFECGHVKAHAKGGDINIENLRPICSNCNKSMGTMNMEEYIKQYGFKK